MPDEVLAVDFLEPIVGTTIHQRVVINPEDWGGTGTGGGGAPTVTYYMAVWNTTNSNWVRWTVTTTPDTAGASYPGPGTFGVDTQTPAIVERVA